MKGKQCAVRLTEQLLGTKDVYTLVIENAAGTFKVELSEWQFKNAKTALDFNPLPRKEYSSVELRAYND